MLGRNCGSSAGSVASEVRFAGASASYLRERMKRSNKEATDDEQSVDSGGFAD